MSTGTLKSRLYTGHVRHRRHGPVPHSFRFPLMMLYLDLSELDIVFRRRWLWSAQRPNVAWFRRADYLDPEVPSLDEAVRRRVAKSTGKRPAGPIRVLTHIRTWGYCFNPITVYYCFRTDGRTLDAVVTEITNTPWGERHADVLPVVGSGRAEGWHELSPRFCPWICNTGGGSVFRAKLSQSTWTSIEKTRGCSTRHCP